MGKINPIKIRLLVGQCGQSKENRRRLVGRIVGPNSKTKATKTIVFQNEGNKTYGTYE